MYFLIELKLRLGEYEKNTYTTVIAQSKEDAKYIVLTGECHNEPDFSQFPDKNAVWDGSEYIYEIHHCHTITEEEYNLFNKYKI